MVSQREKDYHAEKQVGLFLDRNLYSNEQFRDFERVTDKASQLRGVDVMFSWGGFHNVKVDEKAMTHYINMNLPTFAFELESKQSYDGYQAWFVGDENVTEFYILIYLWASRDFKKWELDQMVLDDLERARCIFIRKNVIQEYLESEGFTSDKLAQIVEEIRGDGTYGRHKVDEHENIYFFYTNPTDLVEMPINVIIRRPILEELSTTIFDVTKEGINH